MVEQPAPALHDDADNAFCSFYATLPSVTPAAVVRIFDRNGVFVVYGSTDTQLVCKSIYHSQSVIRTIQNTLKLPYVTMTRTVLGQFLQKALYDYKLCIELWEADKNRRSWSCKAQGSPGNVNELSKYFPDMMFRGMSLMALIVDEMDKKISLFCFVTDINERQFCMTKIDDTTSFIKLENLLIRCNIGECLIHDDWLAASRHSDALASTLQRSKVKITPAKSYPTLDFTSKLQDYLSKMLASGTSPDSIPAAEMGLAGCMALDYLQLSRDSAQEASWGLVEYNDHSCLKLDSSALKALSIEDDDPGQSNSMTLYRVLNKCRTPTGSRLLSSWLREPLVDIVKIRERHDIIAEFLEKDALASSLREELKVIPDIPRLLGKFQRGVATLEDVVRCYQVTLRLPVIVECFDIYPECGCTVNLLYKEELNRHSTVLRKFQDLVETTIDMEALSRHEFLIRPDFDDNLGALKRQLNDVMEAIKQEHNSASIELNCELDKKLKLENHITFGYCLRLTRTEAAVLRQQSAYRELQTAKAGVYFTNNSLKHHAQSYSDLSSRYVRHQSALVKEVIQIASSYSSVLEEVSKVLAHLDVMLAFSLVSIHGPLPYVKPRMCEKGSGNIELVNSRHPCLELMDDVTFIPNDVSMKMGESNFLLITGANMGGKSTYIRQVAIVALLAQIGCYVPCESAELPILDAIMARVGAGDSQLKGVSTFMAEMIDTSAIIQNATANTLVIIDELGRGTSTTDGYGLAFGISEHLLTKIGCFTLFATHFHELTTLADTYPGVQNLHVTTHLQSDSATNALTLLYKIAPGSCSKSFGIHVAELARFPPSVVDMARQKLAYLEAAELEGSENDIDQLEIKTRVDELSGLLDSKAERQILIEKLEELATKLG